MAMPRSPALHEKCRKAQYDSDRRYAPRALPDRKTRVRRGFLRPRVRPVNAGGREGGRFFASRGWQAVCVPVVGRGLTPVPSFDGGYEQRPWEGHFRNYQSRTESACPWRPMLVGTWAMTGALCGEEPSSHSMLMIATDGGDGLPWTHGRTAGRHRHEATRLSTYVTGCRCSQISAARASAVSTFGRMFASPTCR